MPRSMLIQCFEGGQKVLVSGVREARGVIVGHEVSAWPRDMWIWLRGNLPRAPGGKRPKGWLKVRYVAGAVRLDFDPRELPPGRYELAIRIEGYDKTRHKTADLRFEDVAALEFPLTRSDKRGVALTRAVSTFDADLERLCTDVFTRLDGMEIPTWLLQDGVRAARKACLLNCLAKLRATTIRNQPLSKHVSNIFFADVDRIYATVTSDFVNMVAAGFRRDSTVHGTHKKLKTYVSGLGFDVSGHELVSFREQVEQRSLQCVVAGRSDGTGPYFCDIDIDLGNFQHSPTGFLIHLGELLHPAPTSHLNLRKKLLNDKAGPFLYYEIV